MEGADIATPVDKSMSEDGAVDGGLGRDGRETDEPVEERATRSGTTSRATMCSAGTLAAMLSPPAKRSWKVRIWAGRRGDQRQQAERFAGTVRQGRAHKYLAQNGFGAASALAKHGRMSSGAEVAREGRFGSRQG